MSFSLFRPKNKEIDKIYLDHASTTPVDAEVLEYMYSIEKKHFANPSSIYVAGLESKRVLTDARKKVVDIIHARPQEIVFTASGTEADNMALFGIVRASQIKKPHIVVSAFEHPAILEAANVLEGEGVFVTKIMPNEEGVIDPKDIEHALTPDTVLVSIMHVNNEIGTIQPLKEIGKVIRDYRHKMQRVQHCDYPYFHSDASQSPCYLDINREKLGVDLMTLDGSKIYGPKGVGALYIKEGVNIAPYIVGGGQEGGKRAGTENVARIAGFALALEKVVHGMEKESERLKDLQKYFFDALVKEFGNEMSINGSREIRIANNINICFPHKDAEFMVIQLDQAGIVCSAASACNNLKDISGSYVIETLGNAGRNCAESSLRFTMGKTTTKAHIDKTIQVLQKVVKK